MLRLRPFTMHKATTAADACRMLAELGDAAGVYAGGTELLIALKLGMARYDHLIDVKGIDELRGIVVEADSLRIGAAVTHREFSRVAGLPGALGLLPDVARGIGNPRVRTAGTLGGSLCFGEPRSDLAILMTAFGAECVVVSESGGRSVPVEELVATPYAADLRPGELLTTVRLGAFTDGWQFAYRKIQWDERPLMGLAVGLQRTSSDAIATSRLALGGSDVPPQRFRAAEQLLCGPAEGLAERVTAAAEVVNEAAEWSDGDGYSAVYKAHLLTVLLRRTLARLAGVERAEGRE
jgi:aerobic carbon-monoxide dehydrogenase medium subunit